MTKIIDFNQMKARKKHKEMMNQQTYSQESYFFYIRTDVLDIKFQYGGAFARDIISKLPTTKENVLKTLKYLYEDQVIAELQNDVGGLISEATKEGLSTYAEESLTLYRNLLDQLTVEYLDKIMSEDTYLRIVIPELLSVMILNTYQPQVLEEMVQNKWIAIDGEQRLNEGNKPKGRPGNVVTISSLNPADFYTFLELSYAIPTEQRKDG